VCKAGQKRHLHWLRHYLVAATRAGPGGGQGSSGGTGGLALHAYDLRNKLVAATLPLPEARTSLVLIMNEARARRPLSVRASLPCQVDAWP
jgi:hypothetical protein